MAKVVDLELDDEGIFDMPMPIPVPTRARYPYEMRIALCGDTLKKMGKEPGDFCIGDVIDLRSFGEVTSVSVDGTGRVEIQLQKLMVENEMDDEDEPTAKSLRSPLHDNVRS